MEGADISSWVETISSELDEKQLLVAKEEYQKLSGPLFQDDKSYESRMGLFLEWYTLYYRFPHSGKIPVMEYIEKKRNQLDDAKTSELETMTHSLHGIFQVTQLSNRYIGVHELFEDKEFRVNETQGDLFFNKKDLFEGNLFSLLGNSPFPMRDDNVFTGNFVYHPPTVFKFLRSKIKAIRAIEKEGANKLKIREKEVLKFQKDLQSSERLLAKIKGKIEKSNKPEKREKLEQEYREQEREQNGIREQLNQAETIHENFKTNEMGFELRARRFELMQNLSYMSLKWERSRQIDINDIYKD